MTPDRIREIFKPLEAGDGAAFFAHVADDVDWTVLGTHPLAGHYHSKAAYAGTFTKLGCLTMVTGMVSRRRRSPRRCSGARLMVTPQVTSHETMYSTTSHSTG